MTRETRNAPGATCLVLAMVAVVLIPHIAQADEAKDSFERGVELYKVNDYKGALAEFLAAYKVKPHHSVLYNIAQCYQMTDAGSEALHYYSLYLEVGADFISDTRKKLVRNEIEKLKEQLTSLAMDIEPEGAQVLLDGKTVGAAPVGIQYVDPGEHTLIVQKTGYKAKQQEFVAKRGEPLEIAVKLKELDQPNSSSKTKLDVNVISSESNSEDDLDDDKVVTEGSKSENLVSGAGTGEMQAEAGKVQAKVPWGAAVGTGALTLTSGVAAIVLGVMNSQHHDDYLALRGDIADGTYTGDDADGDVRAAEDRGKALNAGMGVAIGVTAAAAVVTAVLVPLAIPKKKNVEVQATGTGISVTVSF